MTVCIIHLFTIFPLFFYRKTKRIMATYILGALLLTLVEVIHSEQPVFVPSAAELSVARPENKQDWLHPVIFEPQNKIQLAHSTYQVTAFLDFAPFMNGFRNVQNYIKNFRVDVANPSYFARIKPKSTNTGSLPLLDSQDLEAFIQSNYCQQLPYACMSRIKIGRFLIEIDYFDELFDMI